jgi:2-C-methyl-D-erythritol 4-phosphate cytidylyltransferase
MIWGAIVVAAGRGMRFGGPKQLADLAGAPLVSWSLRAFAGMPEIVDIVVVTEEEWVEQVASIAAQVSARKCSGVVAGGATRQASVHAGLKALPPRCQAVLVHDGARPLVRPNDVRNGMRVVRKGRGAILAVPVVDTVKVVDRTTGAVRRTLDRDTLWAAQTPQFAMATDLQHAYREALHEHVEATDDAALLERIGVEVLAVEGTPENFKITVAQDLQRADTILRERSEMAPNGEEILLVEVFSDESLVDAVCTEFTARGGTIDAVDRDLPQGVVVRAYVASEKFEGFGERFESIASGDATFTTRFSHWGARGGSA